MCGRFILTAAPDSLARLFGVTGARLNFPPRYNIAPTQSVPVIRRDGAARHFAMLRWGLVPSWAKDAKGAAHMINARGETVADKPAFRVAFCKRRCLVPADGFYEWPTIGEDRPKHPFLFTMRDGASFAFAGLWEAWNAPGGEILESFTIINTAANAVMAKYHDRVPIVLDPKDYEAWLDPAYDPRPLIKAPPSEWFKVVPVSTHVNAVRHDDSQCIAPLSQATVAERQGRLF